MYFTLLTYINKFQIYFSLTIIIKNVIIFIYLNNVKYDIITKN